MGTLSLLVGLDLMTGEVHGIIRDRHRSREFIELLEKLHAVYPSDWTIRVDRLEYNTMGQNSRVERPGNPQTTPLHGRNQEKRGSKGERMEFWTWFPAAIVLK